MADLVIVSSARLHDLEVTEDAYKFLVQFILDRGLAGEFDEYTTERWLDTGIHEKNS